MRRWLAFGFFILTILFGPMPGFSRQATAAGVPQFIVSYFKSESISCPRAFTAITVVNNSASTCNIHVAFFASSDPVTAACNVGDSLGPGYAATRPPAFASGLFI